MIISTRTYSFANGKMELISKGKEQKLSKKKVIKSMKWWYTFHPYAKRINKNCICGDYRIDQQRPIRNVYSENYLKIISITEIEEVWFDKLIKEIESKIDYPTVWDDGKNTYYEETIYCPKCGKKRKVLTSKTHCEFCGFEFAKALKCPKCNSLNLKGSKECKKCGYIFRKKSFIDNNDFEVKKDKNINIIKCPKCGEIKSKYFNICQNCGFDYDNDKKKCPKCKNMVGAYDKYCIYCGKQLTKVVECSKCKTVNKIENNFCTKCGNKL